MGDFLGFTFGGYHSSDLGITRVSGGDRYDEQLHPEIKDRTAEVPGVNGNYYFGSDFGPRTIDIEIAYDHLTEEQFRRLRRIFGTKHIQQLIFDERPYKYYMAKIESPIELSYVCFDEQDYEWENIPLGKDEATGKMNYAQGISGDFEYKKYTDKFRRIYKGEGKITFICYFPFAKSAFKNTSFQKTKDTIIHEDKTYYVLNAQERQFDEVENPNVANISLYYEKMEDDDSDWAISSGILSSQAFKEQNIDNYTINIKTLPVVNNENIEYITYNGFKIYNPGDLSTGFRLYCPFLTGQGRQTTYNLTVAYVDDTDIIHSIKIEGLEPMGTDEGFLINTDNGLIQGVSNFAYVWPGNARYNTTGTIYNSYMTAGYFFQLKPEEELVHRGKSYILLEGNHINNPKIFYDYLYF